MQEKRKKRLLASFSGRHSYHASGFLYRSRF